MHRSKKRASNEATIRKKTPRAHQCIQNPESSNFALRKVNRSGSSGYQKERNDLEDSHSEDSPELKILNTETDAVAFLNICDVFEKILNEFDLVEDDSVYEKLAIINKLIEKKILCIKDRKSKYGSLSSLASSTLNLDLIDLNDEKFWKTIICPFCSEFQDNETNLVNHIDNECSLSLVKKMSEQIPFAVFQILPNNTFKCGVCDNSVLKNVQEYFMHKQDSTHLQAFNEATRKKVYSECLFCCCCKILVYNSCAQIQFHISHEEHKNRRKEIKNPQAYKKQGIHYLFGKNKKFKCLNCPSAEYQTPKIFLMHLNTPNHIKLSGNQSHCKLCIFCCVCYLEVHLNEIVSHFTESSTHKENELKGEKTFELCNYCGCVCDNLMNLFLHMKSNCTKIQNIKIKLETSSKPERNHGRETNNNQRKEKSISSGSYITVKDYANIQELFDYFKKFGEIISMEVHNEKDVIIKFQENKVIEDIQLLRNVIKIGDEKLNIIIGIPNKPNKHYKTQMESSNVKEEEKKIEESSPPIVEKRDNSNSIEALDVLFERVSLHLKNNIKMSDSNDEKRIIIDCLNTLDIESCDLVGFSGCELSFPFESVNLFCDLKKIIVNYSSTLHKNLLSENHQALLSSQLWTDVELIFDKGPYSYIKCVHVETQRTCTITFTKSMMLLTSMLRDCMEKNDLVQHFCLILRFWLSVHELQIAECEYAVIALLVFFFIKEEILELSPVFKYQEFLNDKFAKFKIKSRRNKSGTDTVKKLFQTFLQFLRTFDFKNHAICLPTSQPISKTIFTSAEFKLLTGAQNHARLISCSMCIVDPILFKNLAADIEQIHLKALLDVVDSTVYHYNI